ncbi:MAG: hypothetical protein QM760_15065 [Nibricoccus sp.]
MDGITVESLQDRKYREVNNNQFFGYRVGRGKLKPGTAYLLRVLVPDDKRRYFVMDIQTGRNYQGTGYFNGAAADDPNGNYPVTNEYQWYDHIVMNDDVTYGSEGSRTTSSENGFWVFFHDNGRAYTGQYQAGPAVAEIRLYEIGDAKSHEPQIRFPEGAPHRVLMLDWEREPEAPPADVVQYAKLMGFTHLSPTIQKWAYGAYWDNELGFRAPTWHKVSRDGERDEDIYAKWLAATANAGISLVPRVEYGGGPNLPESAKVIGPDGEIDGVGRFINWGANILAPETWDEFSRVIDQIVVDPQQKYPQIAGMLWRQRQDRIKPSYGVRDVELFCRETHRDMPVGTPAEIGKWASQTVGDAYHAWWQVKRADFIRKVRDHLKSKDPSLQLFYYPYDEDGWTLGPKGNSHNSPEDWSDLYDVHRAGEFWKRRLAELRRSARAVRRAGPHVRAAAHACSSGAFRQRRRSAHPRASMQAISREQRQLRELLPNRRRTVGDTRVQLRGEGTQQRPRRPLRIERDDSRRARFRDGGRSAGVLPRRPRHLHLHDLHLRPRLGGTASPVRAGVSRAACGARHGRRTIAARR